MEVKFLFVNKFFFFRNHADRTFKKGKSKKSFQERKKDTTLKRNLLSKLSSKACIANVTAAIHCKLLTDIFAVKEKKKKKIVKKQKKN